MTHVALVATNVIAISLLAFGLYFPRYHRKDILVAIVGLNIGVMAVATALASSEVSAGLGLGLFGVLSIIRLRSTELSQEEVAYYFSALALGLLAGFPIEPFWISPLLMSVILVALALGDHPALFASTRSQTVTLGAAYANEEQLRTILEELLGAKILRLRVKKLDMRAGSTSVEVRFRQTGPGAPLTSAPVADRDPSVAG